MPAPDPELPYHPPAGQAWRAAVAWVVTVGAALAIWHAATVLLLFFAGILGAVLLLCLGRFVARWTGHNIRIALSVVLLVLLASLGALGWIAAPAVLEQTAELRDQLQAAGERIDQWVRQHAQDLPVDDVDEVGEHLSNGAVWSRVAGVFSTTLGALSAAAVILFIAIFMAYDRDRYVSGLLRLVPLRRRTRAAEVLGALNETLSRWLLAQLCSMLFLGLSTWLVLWLLGVPLALVLAILTGILTFVPYLGPLIALVPIVLIALVQGPMLALWTAGAFFVVQNIESNLFMPFVYQKTVRLPPALTLGSQVLAGALFGLPGFMLATPLAAVVMVLIRLLYVQDVLGDDLEQPVQEKAVVADPPEVV